jgi:hypothetical protein
MGKAPTAPQEGEQEDNDMDMDRLRGWMEIA